MKPLLTSLQMKTIENSYFSTGIPSIAVMERAAQALADELFKALEGKGKTCVFACGAGGNGGDGYAAARIFQEKGGRAIILCVYPPKTADARINYDRAVSNAFAVIDPNALETLPRPDAWVDAIFGIGLTRPLDENALRVVERINEDRRKGSFVMSADIPTGLHSDTGEILNNCVYADVTVCFHALKRGHLLGKGLEACGKTVVRSIGIPDEFRAESPVMHTEKEDLILSLPERPRCAHKNDFGHLLIIAGSFGMAGAACLTALSAMRTGAGLVTVACPRSIVPIIQTLAPCAMCLPLEEENGCIAADAVETLSSALGGKTAVAIGPGLGRNVHPKAVEFALKCGLPAVIDADALNCIANNAPLKALLRPHHAITPHPGEAKRLINNPKADAVEYASDLASFGCQVLLKGAASVITGPDGKTFVSSSGTDGMAKGGSGDALTGITGALLAGGKDPLSALWMASEIHGLAGECAQKKFGRRSMLPTDLIDYIAEVLKDADS